MEESGEGSLLEEKESNDQEVVKEEINLQYHWYLFCFFFIYLFSFLLPGIIFLSYIMVIFVPNFLSTTSFIALFIEITPLLTMISFPLITPTKDGVIPRNIRSKTYQL